MLHIENKTEIQKKMDEMLENKFECPDEALTVSKARFVRYIFSEKRKERKIGPYGLTMEEINEEGEKLLDKYIDEKLAENKDNYTDLLYELCYPIYFYSYKKGYEIFCQE